MCLASVGDLASLVDISQCYLYHVYKRSKRLNLPFRQEKMWHMFTRFEVEQAEPGVLGAKESFGKHLHLRGGATGQIQLMQD